MTKKTNSKKNSTTRNTIQKIKILEYLKCVKTHPDAECVYNAVKKELPTISLATVYRVLNQLAEKGEINKILAGDSAHFDGDTCHHQHCVCKKCGKIIDVFQKEITEYALNKANTKGFSPECVCITYSGICSECR